jgi:hypothetical protein
VLFVEVVIYVFYLLIKALKIYIRKSNNKVKRAVRKSKVGAIGIVVFNIILVAFFVAMPYIQRNSDIYNTENVIICNQNDVDTLAKLLDDDKIHYKIIGKTKVKMQSINDFEEAKKIAQDNAISCGFANVVH